jgi:small ligand-binding sensory domain FIST
MESFKFGHASASRWQEAVQACLVQIGHPTTSANLGFLYTSDLLADDISEILDYLKQQTGVPHWVGTVGVGICSHAIEYFDVPAIAVMLGHFHKDSFQVFTTITDEFDEFSRTRQLIDDNERPLFAIVHGDPRNDQIGRLILQLSKRLGGGFLVGGLTSSRSQYLQIADGLIEGGLSGVLFGNNVAVSTRLTQGCSAIGPRRQITKATNNIIIHIDNHPALDVLNEDLGGVLTQDISKIAGYIFAALPIIGSDMGNYLVRNLIGIDPENKLLAIGESVTPGMPIVFTRCDAQTAHDNLVGMLTKFKSSLTGMPKGGVYYSCLGRGKNLFGDDSQELKIIQKILGDFPLVGFFANGEISHQHLYGYTGVLTLFL